MLLELSKQDEKWRALAFKICNDKSLADDLVQDMYLKIHKGKFKRANDGFVYKTLVSLFIDYLRQRHEISIEEFYYIECRNRIFEPDDGEQLLLEKFSKLEWQQQELIAESYDRSLRDIERIYPMINYAYAYRQIKIGIKEVLGDDLHMYKNARIKYKKPKKK